MLGDGGELDLLCYGGCADFGADGEEGGREGVVGEAAE